MFRGKYLEELKRLWEEDKLVFHGTAEKFRNHYTFKELLDSCYGTVSYTHLDVYKRQLMHVVIVLPATYSKVAQI